MIKSLTLDDEDIFEELGLLINNDFKNLYNLKKILEDCNQGIYGYYLDEKLVGFVHYSKSFETIDIINIVVGKDYRRRGIASMLINFLKKIKDVQSIFLEVNVANREAIEVYKKNGFMKIWQREKYYGNDDALVMKWGD